MNVSRFIAADMRQAIRQIRDALGPDAVILSNRKVDEGIEIIAAIDYDETLLFNNQSASDKQIVSTTEEAQQAIISSSEETSDVYSKQTVYSNAEELSASSQNTNLLSEDNSESVSNPGVDEMRAEIVQMRNLLENQLAHFAWGEMKTRQPAITQLIRRLERIQLDKTLIREISQLIPSTASQDQAWKMAVQTLCDRLPVFKDDLLADGGVIALVGATGVGKTTSIAKLAARYILRYGQRHLGLVTTDGYRIAAYDQLLTFGQILGIPVQIVSGNQDLESTLRSISDKRLVLIDTAGMSQRDKRIQDQITILTEIETPVKTVLVLSATTQIAVLEQTIESFNADSLCGVIITKLDEAASLGGLISLLIKKQLPVTFIGDGQRVPEDMHIAREQTLIQKAIDLSDLCDYPEDDRMAEQYGGVEFHAAI
ncbi:MAG: flagellar biosynthesis protein FlhF [Gammaproteobacteria bacterium]